MACHAVRLLASAPKDRTSSEHADWVTAKVALGEALVEVPDYAHCVHTRAGQNATKQTVTNWLQYVHIADSERQTVAPPGWMAAGRLSSSGRMPRPDVPSSAEPARALGD
jgi:hypothetical protein